LFEYERRLHQGALPEPILKNFREGLLSEATVFILDVAGFFVEIALTASASAIES
jgi:hypothetical protein